MQGGEGGRAEGEGRRMGRARGLGRQARTHQRFTHGCCLHARLPDSRPAAAAFAAGRSGHALQCAPPYNSCPERACTYVPPAPASACALSPSLALPLSAQLADEAVCIGEAASSESYLNIPNLLAAAISRGAQAIHPVSSSRSKHACTHAHACSRRMPRYAVACEPSSRTMACTLWYQRHGQPVRAGCAARGRVACTRSSAPSGPSHPTNELMRIHARTSRPLPGAPAHAHTHAPHAPHGHGWLAGWPRRATASSARTPSLWRSAPTTASSSSAPSPCTSGSWATSPPRVTP